MTEENQTRHEIQRGWIMRYLVTAGFKSIPPVFLLYELRDKGCAATWRGLNFHLEYLELKGWVTLERPPGLTPEKAEEKDKFLFVRLTAAGVDTYDRRKASEPGVRF